MPSCATAGVSGREPAGRGALRSGRGRRRHQRACGRMVLPPRRGAAGAHPHSRQSRRFRRPRQAQRVHARWPSRHRLWRQPVDRLARIHGGAMPARGCCAISASTCGASRPRSSATSIPRSACRAACSFAREAFGRDRAGDRRSADHAGRTRSTPAARQRQAARRVRRRASRSPTQSKAQLLGALYAHARSARRQDGRGEAASCSRPRAIATT